MSVVSLIKLIIIGAGMFFYYKTMEEEGGFYISSPIIGAAVLVFTLSLTLGPLASNIFLGMFYTFLYFTLAFMAQTEPNIAITFFIINMITELGSRFGLINPFIPLIVFIISAAVFYTLQYVDVDFIYALFKFFLIIFIFLIIWTYLKPRVFLFFYKNLPHFLIWGIKKSQVPYSSKECILWKKIRDWLY